MFPNLLIPKPLLMSVKAGDPTQGYVDYISQSDAQSAGLIDTSNGQIRMSVDSKNVASGRGRKSVRLTSKAKYNHGLIVLDLEHMPGSICGTWPACRYLNLC